jgi:PilZ domain-containing protein
MVDRRRFERFSVNILDMNGKMMFARNVKIVNISMGGISFKADRRLNIGRNYSVKLENKDRVLTMEGSVVSSVLGESQKDSAGDIVPIYTAGMKFTKVSDESRLKEIINLVMQQQE